MTKLRDSLISIGKVFNVEVVRVSKEAVETCKGVEYDCVVLEEMCKTQQSFEKVSKDLKERIEEFETDYYEEDLPKKKKKRNRMSRIEKMAMYGGSY